MTIHRTWTISRILTHRIGQSQTIEREPFQPKHILKDMGIVSVVRDTLQSITDHLGRLLFLHSNLTHDARVKCGRPFVDTHTDSK